MRSICFLFLFLSAVTYARQSDSSDFEKINSSDIWSLKFSDVGDKKWQTKWFLDGIRATITNSSDGMNFAAGEVEGDDACHAVLWTKDSFRGDVKIEYNYTRTDTRASWVNILYVQATGVSPFAKDIQSWSNERIIPSMKTYYMNMKALHVSYAAYDEKNMDLANDYVRVRRYPLYSGQDFATSTEISPASFRTGLFKPGETYHITVIKTAGKLYFNVVGKKESKLFAWSLSGDQLMNEGRIGLRHMFTRSARYKDFRVYIRK